MIIYKKFIKIVSYKKNKINYYLIKKLLESYEKLVEIY